MKLKINRNLLAATFIFTFFAPFVSAEQVECSKYGNLAEKIMSGRQLGVPISKFMELLPDYGSNADFYKEMVFKAFEEPAYSNSENQKRAKREFRNKIEFMCYKDRQN